MQKIAPGLISSTATISYISPMEDKLTREVQQRRVWHFSCSCPLCTEENLVELQKHSLKCRVDNCEGGRPVKEQQEVKEDYEPVENPKVLRSFLWFLVSDFFHYNLTDKI